VHEIISNISRGLVTVGIAGASLLLRFLRSYLNDLVSAATSKTDPANLGDYGERLSRAERDIFDIRLRLNFPRGW